MKKVLFALMLVLAVPILLQGCAAVPGLVMIPVNMMAAGGITKSAQERKADKCAEIDTQAEKDKVTRIERNRRLTAASCPI